MGLQLLWPAGQQHLHQQQCTSGSDDHRHTAGWQDHRLSGRRGVSQPRALLRRHLGGVGLQQLRPAGQQQHHEQQCASGGDDCGHCAGRQNCCGCRGRPFPQHGFVLRWHHRHLGLQLLRPAGQQHDHQQQHRSGSDHNRHSSGWQNRCRHHSRLLPQHGLLFRWHCGWLGLQQQRPAGQQQLHPEQCGCGREHHHAGHSGKVHDGGQRPERLSHTQPGGFTGAFCDHAGGHFRGGHHGGAQWHGECQWWQCGCIFRLRSGRHLWHQCGRHALHGHWQRQHHSHGDFDGALVWHDLPLPCQRLGCRDHGAWSGHDLHHAKRHAFRPGAQHGLALALV